MSPKVRDKNMRLLPDLIRACRLPFLSASVIPFIAGSFAARGAFIAGSFASRSAFSPGGFCLGLAAVALTHTGANLINDYADSRSGADWKDRRFFGFFGGSKLIQEGVFTERFFLLASLACYAAAFLAVSGLVLGTGHISILWYFLAVAALSVSYSVKPLQLSYKSLGEPLVFTLFGPVVLGGGYFIQSGMLPGAGIIALSLPFAFLVTLILFANEVADAADDKEAGKRNWTFLPGAERACVLYWLLNTCAAGSILLNMAMGSLGSLAWLSFLYLVPAAMAGKIIRDHHSDKEKLAASSRLVIMMHLFASLVITADIIL